jgi:hypothetical protein
MKVGSNLAAVAALLGDPARANLLTALMLGRELTATESALGRSSVHFVSALLTALLMVL